MLGVQKTEFLSALKVVSEALKNATEIRNGKIEISHMTEEMYLEDGMIRQDATGWSRAIIRFDYKS